MLKTCELCGELRECILFREKKICQYCINWQYSDLEDQIMSLKGIKIAPRLLSEEEEPQPRKANKTAKKWNQK